MIEKKIKFSCAMDCFDVCSMVATVKNGKVVEIQGDREHPMTKGFICEKGKKHLERLYHPERILKPRRRIGNDWIDITWDEALNEISAKLMDIKKQYGTKAVMYFNDAGYGGLSKTVDEMFFNYYGGVTVPRGSLCWGAGIKAQKYDFGDARGHHPKDHLQAKNIIIWGRNPFNTNIHLMDYLSKAKKDGVNIILIDPIKTKTANIATEHIYIRPSTDGALALGMAHVIINNDLIDKEFIKKYVIGFELFKEYVMEYTPEKVSAITGIKEDVIINLAMIYGANKPSCIILGYGLQRYSNGGNNIRCIDALGAITGNIGIAGGGVNYANKWLSKYIGGEVEKSYNLPKEHRSYSKTKLGEFLETASDPPVKCIFVMKANPIVQVPNINRTMEAFKKVDFKVVIDMFMTDTAKLADIVLPCTSVMEEEDLIYSSMFTPYLNYSHRVVDPPDGMMGEYELFRELAARMNLEGYPHIDKDEFFRRAMGSICEKFNITLEEIKEQYFTIPKQEVPWQDKKFATPSHKFELYSDLAQKDGLSPIPEFLPPLEGDRQYPLRLLTPHGKHSLHSQHFAFVDDIPEVYMNQQTLRKHNLNDGAMGRIHSNQGQLVARIKVDDQVGEDILMIYEGWWHKSGSVNFLTEDLHSDMGEQTAYYDCFCRIEPL